MDSKTIKRFLAELPEGWNHTKTQKGHYRITGPLKQIVFCGSKVSEPRTLKNITSQLRNAGCAI